jgi:hypothetical protein
VGVFSKLSVVSIISSGRDSSVEKSTYNNKIKIINNKKIDKTAFVGTFLKPTISLLEY